MPQTEGLKTTHMYYNTHVLSHRLWSSKVQHGSHWAKIKRSAGFIPLGVAAGECFLLFGGVTEFRSPRGGTQVPVLSRAVN